LIVWDLLNKTEHIVKFQKKTFGAGLKFLIFLDSFLGIFDIAWSEGSDRLLVVGDGKDVFD
jgi:hypothetical protein